MAKSLPKGWMPRKAADFRVNPTGNFVVGGPDGDCGLTAANHRRHLRRLCAARRRRLLRQGPNQGRSLAAYAARYLAKNVVAAGLADRCLIQVAYAIGVADPMSLYVNTEGTGKVDERKLEKVLSDHLPLRPTNIRRGLQLNNRSTSAPRPTVTSAASRRRTAPFRGSGSIVSDLKRAFGAR